MLLLEKMIVLLIVIEVLYQVFPEALRATRMVVLLPIRMMIALLRAWRMTRTVHVPMHIAIAQTSDKVRS